jgi:DnaJ-class molecular chaperone
MSPERKSQPSPDGPPKTCPDCQGRGWTDNRCLTPDQAQLCGVCNGRGTDTNGKECVSCRGTGQIETRSQDRLACTLCNGAGVYPVPESMTLEEFAFHPRSKRK